MAGIEDCAVDEPSDDEDVPESVVLGGSSKGNGGGGGKWKICEQVGENRGMISAWSWAS